MAILGLALVSVLSSTLMGGMMTPHDLWFGLDCASSCSSLLRFWYLACSAAYYQAHWKRN